MTDSLRTGLREQEQTPYESVKLSSDTEDLTTDSTTRVSSNTKRNRLLLITVVIGAIILIVVLSVVLTNKEENTAPESIEEKYRKMVLNVMDKTADPCSNFYRYACGNWDDTTVIPPTAVRTSKFYQSGSEIDLNNLATLKYIIQQLNPPLLSEYYSSCMSNTESNRLGMSPLVPYLTLINELTNGENFNQNLIELISKFHLLNVPVFFQFTVANDLFIPDLYLVQIYQAGLGLSPSYYVNSTPSQADLLSNYQNHISNILLLVSNQTLTLQESQEQAKEVLYFETLLANMSVIYEESDFLKLNESYNKLNQTDFIQQYSNVLNWTQYFSDINLSSTLPINTVEPTYFHNLSSLLQTANSSVLQWYLQWQLGHVLSNYLSDDFVTETFNFYNKYLNGQQQQPTREDFCFNNLRDNLPLGNRFAEYFINESFSGESQTIANDLFNAEIQAFINRLPSYPWLDNSTREMALLKATKMLSQMGTPNISSHPDLSSLIISNESFFNNAIETAKFQFSWVVVRAGEKVDISHWDLMAQFGVFAYTLTAFNAESPNAVFFPASVLQFPIFNSQLPPAANFGAIGMVLGHEITHSFDNLGRSFDADGKLFDWWSNESTEAFNNGAQCFINQYNLYEVQPGLNLSGTLTLAENIADNGGIQLAWDAYQSRVGGQGKSQSIVPPFSNDELFFLAFGQEWCFKMTTQYEQSWVKSNSHSTPKFRVTGVLSNFQPFSNTFNCAENSTYNQPNKCQIW